MYNAFLLSIKEWLKFGIRLARALPYAGVLAFFPRLILFICIWLLSGVLNAFHWLGFLIDECVFFAYRKTHISQPLFVIGIPRSGTTWLQRVLAKDANATSLTLWECIFAPSISQRYLFKGLSFALTPISKVLGLISGKLSKFNATRFLGNFNEIHKLGLHEPEEDFLLLLPLHACFLMILLCPRSSHYWNLAKFDDAVDIKTRNTILLFYKRCIQKHIYFHSKATRDSNIRFVSKNPSFTPFLESLRMTFPDAHFVACIREPEATIPSQLSSLMPAAKLLGIRDFNREFVNRIIDLLKHYYQVIEINALQQDLTLIDNRELHKNLKQTVVNLYATLNIPLEAEYLQELTALDESGRQFKSKHHYNNVREDSPYRNELKQFSVHWQKLNDLQTVNK